LLKYEEIDLILIILNMYRGKTCTTWT